MFTYDHRLEKGWHLDHVDTRGDREAVWINFKLKKTEQNQNLHLSRYTYKLEKGFDIQAKVSITW